MSNATEHVRDEQLVTTDIRTIVGGNYTPDSLGEGPYQEIRDRAQSRARDYMRVFDRMYLGTGFDAVTQSELYLPSFLELIAEHDAPATRDSARCLKKLYEAVLLAYDDARDKDELFKLLPDETGRLLQRLDVRRIELAHLPGVRAGAAP